MQRLPTISVVILKVEVDKRDSKPMACQWLDLCTQCVASLLTLYRPMTRFSVMKLMFPYDQWRVLASWIHTCVCKSFPEDSGELRTSFFGNSIHHTYRKLNCAYLRRDSVGMSRKLNEAKRVMLSQTKRSSLSRPISRSKQGTEMKQKATNS